MAQRFDHLYIGGKWVSSQTQFDDLNPADGSVWAQIADSDAAAARKRNQCSTDRLSPLVRTKLF